MQAFKQLLWKEWRQNWLKGLVIILLGLPFTGACSTSHEVHSQDWGTGIFLMLTAVSWSITSMLMGSRLIADESKNFTLSLLRAMPITQLQIWSSKMLTGVTIVFTSISICALLLCYGGIFSGHIDWDAGNASMRMLFFDGFQMIFPCFSLGMLCGSIAMTSRPLEIITLVIGFPVSIITIDILENLILKLMRHDSFDQFWDATQGLVHAISVIFVSVILTTLSYWVFCRPKHT